MIIENDSNKVIRMCKVIKALIDTHYMIKLEDFLKEISCLKSNELIKKLKDCSENGMIDSFKASNKTRKFIQNTSIKNFEELDQEAFKELMSL